MLMRAQSGGSLALDAATPPPPPSPAHSCSCKVHPDEIDRHGTSSSHRPRPRPPLPHGHAGDVCGRRGTAVLWRVASAELVGTALLVALGGLQGGGALGAGLVVAALVQCFVRVSGAQLNPAVTAAAVVAGRMPWRRAALEVAAQAVGATLGAVALRVTVGRGAGAVPAARASPAATLALEACAGAVLALANCGEWDPRAAPHSDSWPLRIGATVAALTLATERSGASMNPARHFGPALVNGVWSLWWAYWTGPVCGAVLAAAAYRLAWYPPPVPPSPPPTAPCPRCCC